ncbi:tumor susceptibility gene 101 protein-like [Liolophura sinensis]|uniref:tumor susceptibility gene 101 protein-like n=1 Tax=Liolophura sinensis TaxID=3198878 RepID=UPI003159478C
MTSAAGHDGYIKNALQKYKYPDMAKRDVLSVFTTYTDLRPKLEPYVFNDGISKDLLCLEGTVPVSYKGNTYNIPVCLWVLDTHPYNPPLVYVRPTNTMRIRSGRHVDANGKIDLPYLREWKYPQSDLLGLVHVLCIVFGEEPPVYATGGSSGGPTNRYPGQTPYPPAGQGFPMPMPGGGGTGNTPYPSNYPNTSGSNQNQGYTPYPSYSQPGGYMSQSYPSSNPGYPSYPNQGSPYPQTGQTPPWGAYPPNPGYPGSHGSQSSYPGGTNSTPGTNGPGSTNTVTEEHLKASLLSAVEDKMKRRLKETFAQAQAEMDVLYKTQSELQSGKTKLETMISDLKREKEEVDRNIRMLTEKDQQIKENLSKMESQDKVEIDDAVVTTAPLYKQLLNSFAEEQAIEDAIYYLGEGLRRNVIDLDVFLKKVRELSRRQFMLRALIQKCREKAGLAA